MRIAFIGLGKLGLPVATCMALGGHDVVGYDVDARRRGKAHRRGVEAGLFPLDGRDFADYLADAERLTFAESIVEAVRGAEIIFIAVQTPHAPEYEGITSLPDSRRDFDYTWLADVLRQLAGKTGPGQIVAVISTVLPGTTRRLVADAGLSAKVVYNPSFIAMGTTMRDFMRPEFVLLGSDDPDAIATMREFYYFFVDAPVCAMSVESAELTKVAYNTFIALKLAFANLIGEICHKIECADVDQVTGALALAKRRLLSPAYLQAGMGDGGACHPRDNIAMSWLARKLDLHFDLFDTAMMARERHAEWLADLCVEHAGAPDRMLPIYIAGTAYKPESAIETGSHALLVASLLDARDMEIRFYDPVAEREWDLERGVYLIGCRHKAILEMEFPDGSVVIDPWRLIEPRDGIKLVSIGR